MRPYSSPLRAEAALTSRCNLRCRYCHFFGSAGEKKRELDTAEWQGIFDELGAMKVMELTLTGGEGEESTLTIEGSPAVYGNLMIIGTTGKDAGGVYCIKIE